MTTHYFILPFACFTLLWGATISLAGVVQVNEKSTEKGAFGIVSGTDLINQGQPTLESHARSPEGRFGDNTNDGKAGHGSMEDGEFWPVTSQPNTLNYRLNTTLNPQGYDIGKIQIVTGWIAAEESQANLDFNLFVSKVGSDTFTSVGLFRYKPFSNERAGPYSARVILTNDTGAIASGVDVIRFKFSAASSGNFHPGLLIREIDVEGTPTGQDQEEPSR